MPTKLGGRSLNVPSRIRAFSFKHFCVVVPLAVYVSCAVAEESDPRDGLRETIPQAGYSGQEADASTTAGSGGRSTGGRGGTSSTAAGRGGKDSGSGAPDGGDPEPNESGGGAGVGGAGGAGGASGASGAAGNGGAAGAAGQGNDACKDAKVGQPGAVVPRNGWKATAFDVGEDLFGTYPEPNAIDGYEETRWTSGTGQKGAEWFRVDLGQKVCISEVELQSYDGDDPAAYQLSLSLDDATYTKVAEGKGADPTKIKFTRQPARYIRVVQTGTKASNWWSIHEFVVRY